MNTFVSFIPHCSGNRSKKNNIMCWLNKPTFQQLGANLAPLQNFVKRKTSKNPFYFGAQHLSDDQTVDTTSTWDDKLRIQHDQRQPHPRIKQTVVYVSRSIITPPPQHMLAEQTAREKSQRRSQQKNKVLMLLQLEQVATQRAALRQQWRILLQDFFVEVLRSRIDHRRVIRLNKLAELDQQIRTKRRAQPNPPLILDLEEYYQKFDSCLEELHDRNEIMELEAFKQLVIGEVEERAEAQHVFRERLKVVHGQLMQKFIVEELIQGGLYSGPRRPEETLNEWIHISDDFNDQRNAIPDSPEEGSEWVVCDF